MRNLLAWSGAVALLPSIAAATNYPDADDDVFDLGFQHLDIVSVDVGNDADWLYISIQLDADIDATTWGKYMVAFDTRSGGVDGNGWNRPIEHGRDNDFWVGSWADDGGSGAGGELWEYSDGDGAWQLVDASYQAGTDIVLSDADHANGRQLIRVSLAALGVTVGEPIFFDVMSSGGGDNDPGVDHLSRADLATPFWDTPSIAGDYAAYTVVPAPGAAGLLGVAGLAILRRRRG